MSRARSADGAARARYSEPARDESTCDPRILIVDDDGAARAEAARCLREVGFVVDEADNGLDGLKCFQVQRPHIALLDVDTPFLDGFSTCRAMRELRGGEDVSIVMMTSVDDIESLQFGYNAGATDFVVKPVNTTILQHRMKYMLRAAHVVDQLRRSERKIAHIAYHDNVTGLPNRRALERYMSRLLESPPPGPRSGAIFLVDLDGFKRVNDTFGHSAGDELICEIGRRITRCFGVQGSTNHEIASSAGLPLVARLGGDEFALVEPAIVDVDEAAAAANRLLEVIGSPFDLRGHEILITASIGIALLSEGYEGVEAMVRNADAAMYEAKAHDRNNARFYSPQIRDRARAQLDIESALRRGLAQGELYLVYQPKVETVTGRVTGAEALLRWRRASGETVPPNEFIPIAEETGLIVPIGTWVLREACRQVAEWHRSDALSGLRIAVNVSARQFRDTNFLQVVREALEDSGLSPFALELEITEGTLMTDTRAGRTLLEGLKAMGIWVALDDFGTGYSSLGYLRRFPIDTLKVDRSFVHDLLVDDGSAAITGAVIAMANRLRLNVVAEGVETRDQLEFLQTLGCSEVQGYFFSPPLQNEAFLRWIAGRTAHEPLSPPRRLPAGIPVSAIPPLNR